MALEEARPATGLRERKKEQVRNALHREALNLFALNGFAETSVDEIAAAAEVSRSTFFRYFPSKEAVLFDGYDEIGEELAELLRARPPHETPIQAFEAAWLHQAEHADISRHRAVAEARNKLLQTDPAIRSRHMEFVQKWESRIARIFADRGGRAEISEADHLGAAICIAVANRVTDQWFGSGGTVDPRDLLRNEFALLREVLNGPS